MTVRTRAAVFVIIATVLAGCSAQEAPEQGRSQADQRVDPRAASLKEGFSTMDGLVEAAKKEGVLVVAGLPHDWVDFGQIISAFSDKYGIRVRELEPQANSARQIALAAETKQKADAPDVFDLTLDVAVANKRDFAPYRVQSWQDIPDHLKDHGGAWYAAYGGYMSIGYDPRKVAAPSSFADLLKPGYTVALPGDPRRAAGAFHGVMAASLAPAASDTEPQGDADADTDAEEESSGIGPSGADAERGVRFFARLKRTGNLATGNKAPNTVIDWDHVNARRSSTAGEDAWKVVVPRDAVLASYHIQAISKRAAHPAAARLWQEFLFSDEGQNLYLKGGARPVRADAMQAAGSLDTAAWDALPPVSGQPVVLTEEQNKKASAYLAEHWAAAIG